MKTIAIAFFALLSFSSISQIERIESTKLDSLIWKKINAYRISKGIAKCTIFDTSSLKEFSHNTLIRISDFDIESTESRHSHQVGIKYEGECLFMESGSGNLPEMTHRISEMSTGDFENIANNIVNSWIQSKTHNMVISMPDFTKSTVSAIIILDKTRGYYRVDAVYQCTSIDFKIK
jgi:hypothetical protein